MLSAQTGRLTFASRRAERRRVLTLCAALLVFGGALVLAACGATSGGGQTVPPGATATSAGSTTTPGPTQVTGQSAYAYLFSRVDYPLQIPVNSGDTVTLTLSPHSSILTATPSAGSGTASVGNPIPLPTDLNDYQDIGAAVDTRSASAAASSIVWQLVSAPRQTLLTPARSGEARAYLDGVKFTWHVQAVSAGQNLMQITLHLYYIYLDGSEHDGSISVTQSPIPMVAIAATPLNTTLPPLRLPIAGLSWLAGIIAAIRFIWGAIHTFHDIADPVKDIAGAAQAIHTRIAGATEATSAHAPAAHYPNPWAQRTHPPASLHAPPTGAAHPVSEQSPPPAQRPWPPTQ